jgi:hypothetical protein
VTEIVNAYTFYAHLLDLECYVMSACSTLCIVYDDSGLPYVKGVPCGFVHKVKGAALTLLTAPQAVSTSTTISCRRLRAFQGRRKWSSWQYLDISTEQCSASRIPYIILWKRHPLI